MSDEILLEATNVRKWFGGVRAVDGCSIQIRAGHVTGLIGPNGAGKSTMVSLLAGSLKPDGGTITLLDKDVTGAPTWKRARQGLIRTFQVSRELGHMTVLDNLMVTITPQPGETLFAAFFRGARVAPTRAAHVGAGLHAARSVRAGKDGKRIR